MSDHEESPKRRPPLGLPVGSVRALLTLFTIAVVTLNVANGRDLDSLWVETLLISLAHYFTSRRFINLPPHVLKKIKAEGLIEEEPHPLFLPRHSIRVLIIGAFVGLGYYLYREQRLLETRAVTLLGMVAAYILGCIVRGCGAWLGSRSDNPPSRLWGDIKALVVLGAILAVGIPELLDVERPLPEEAHTVALGLMLFYFGSR